MKNNKVICFHALKALNKTPDFHFNNEKKLMHYH